MTKNHLLTAVLLLITMVTKAQTYSGGAGTETDPYQIATLTDLQYLSENTSEWSKHFIQTTNINASDTKTWNIGDHDENAGTPDEAMGFSPIGKNPTDNFSGSYNGKGHVIDSLYINRAKTNYIGLFGYMSFGASIDSLGVTNVDIEGYALVGSLAGESQYSCIINNCFSTGNIRNNHMYLGGLVGYNYESTINNCYSQVNANSNYNYVGGLVGYNTGSINKCYSSGPVDGNSYLGGLIGSGNGNGTVSDSFWDTETSGQTVSNGGTGLKTIQMKGMCVYADSLWDFMIENANGTYDFWGLNPDVNNGYPFLSWQNYLHTESCCGYTIPQGEGTEDNPYEIATLCDLKWLSMHNSVWDKYFIQTANINASTTKNWNIGNHDNDTGTPNEAMGFSPIGEKPVNNFSGSYNGQGHVIDSLYINRTKTNYIGLFGYMSFGASIDSLGVTNVDITGYATVGSLAGESQYSCEINNCFSTGNISNNHMYLGGLVGINYESSINNCYSQVNANSNYSYVGGLVGYNAGSINKCYSSGSVDGNSYPGGLIGSGNGSGTVSNSFWDTETSGQTVSDGGTGLNTTQMQEMCAYADSTWDFMMEDINGTDDIWGLNANENEGYPFLSWQGFYHTGSCCGYIDLIAPTITCFDNQTIDLTSGQTVYTVSGTEFDPDTTYDNCTIASITNDFNSSSTLAGVELPIGTSTIAWTVTDEAGYTSTCSFNIEVNEFTGLNNIKDKTGFTIYPNPANDYIEIEINNSEIKKIEVLDILGKIVKSTSVIQNKSIIQIDDLKSGVYFITIDRQTQKFIKQ